MTDSTDFKPSEIDAIREFQRITGFGIMNILGYASSAMLSIGEDMSHSGDPDTARRGREMVNDYLKLPVFGGR